MLCNSQHEIECIRFELGIPAESVIFEELDKRKNPNYSDCYNYHSSELDFKDKLVRGAA